VLLMKRNLSSAEGGPFGYHPKMGCYPDLYNHLLGRRRVKTSVLIAAAATLVLIAWIVRPRFTIWHPPPRMAIAVTQMATFRVALGAFRDDTGFYPPGTNGLQGLLEKPAWATNWHGPYVRDIPRDPWGRAYTYECPGRHTVSGCPYDLFSLGPPGTSNLIANWENPSLRP